MQPFWRSSAYPSQRQPVCSTMPRRTLRSQPEANNARSREGRSSSATSGNSSSTPTHSRSLQNFHQSAFSILMDLWWNMSRYKYTVKTSIFSSVKMYIILVVHPIWNRQEDMPGRISGQEQHLHFLHHDDAEYQVWSWPGKTKAESWRHHHGYHPHAEAILCQDVTEEVRGLLLWIFVF